MTRIKILNKGFTLLELLVVVLIVGILAAIALPQYQLAVNKAQFATIKNVGEAIAKSIQMYYLIHNIPPENLENLDLIPSGELTSSKKNVNIDSIRSCYLGNSDSSHQEIVCYIANKGFRYLISVYYNGQITRICRTTTTDHNDINNKLCQAETKLSKASRCKIESSYCNYEY